MPVMKAEYSSGIRLPSPGVKQATMPATPIRRATNTSEMPMYHVMIFQFMGFHAFLAQIYRPDFHLSIQLLLSLH